MTEQNRESETERAETSFLACCIHISCGLLLPGLEIESLARLRLGKEIHRERERESGRNLDNNWNSSQKVANIYSVFYCSLLHDLLFVIWVDPTEFNTINWSVSWLTWFMSTFRLLIVTFDYDCIPILFRYVEYLCKCSYNRTECCLAICLSVQRNQSPVKSENNPKYTTLLCKLIMKLLKNQNVQL